MTITREPLFAEVHNVPDDYTFTTEELDRIIGGDMFTPRQAAIMAREIKATRKAATLAPGVPDESAVELLATDLMKRIDKITGERHSVATLSSLRVSIVESCRAAMQGKAEPVSQPSTLRDGVESLRSSSISIDAGKIMAERDALNSPVIPDGWVACSERMPEKREMDIWLFNGEGVYHGYVWDGFGFTDWNEEYNSLPGVTHWMPMSLPAAPQQEVKP